MTWLLCDYGEVLSGPQPESAIAVLADLCGLAPDDFVARYWDQRVAYDRGDLTVEAYWATVLGGRAPERSLLAELVEVDVAGWLHPSEPSLAGVGRAAERGLRLAILSNAPHEVARALDRQPWLDAFAPRLFSCDLRVVKPDAGCYLAALDALGARPDEVRFFDDRPANVEAARALGMQAEVFTDPAQFDAVEVD